jgi:hypothetical protein
MLSTLSGSIEFLEGEEFMKLIRENPLKTQKPISPPSEIKSNPEDKEDINQLLNV